ncbi:hypothetical protein MAM1_0978d11395, partial [Mucor ambiguus]
MHFSTLHHCLAKLDMAKCKPYVEDPKRSPSTAERAYRPEHAEYYQLLKTEKWGSMRSRFHLHDAIDKPFIIKTSNVSSFASACNKNSVNTLMKVMQIFRQCCIKGPVKPDMEGQGAILRSIG